MKLMPGDVISTGTSPGGDIGQKLPVYLKEGQGEQRQTHVQA